MKVPAGHVAKTVATLTEHASAVAIGIDFLAAHVRSLVFLAVALAVIVIHLIVKD